MNRLKVYTSAVTFAHGAIDMTGHTLETAAISAFDDQKLDPRDWDYWRGQVNDARSRALSARDGKLQSETEDAAKK
jgi:hypothetical protein